jgi:ribosomal protein S18 acetylase RimI-like enzyme
MQVPSPKSAVLTNATLPQLEQAIVQNHTELFVLNALALGGDVHTKEGITCTYAGIHGGNIAFPVLTEHHAGALLDEAMAWYQSQAPAGMIGYWSLYPPQPAHLDVLLLARGFQTGWRPNWMALDLEMMNENHPAPPALQIVPDNTTPTYDLKDLPYAGNNGAVWHETMQQHPDKIQRFLAMLDGKIIGQSAVVLTSGAHGVGGMYNVGVLPDCRQQGIGKAVVLAACRYAKEKGYRYMTLNGTGRRMYEQVGFKTIGSGLTWWLNKDRYAKYLLTANQVAIAEAVGFGNITELDRIRNQVTVEELNIPLANGMSLLGLAAHCRQPASAEWLLTQGISVTALDAWNLGWKDRTRQLLAADPQEVNRQYPDINQTLLHIAAEKNDYGLAQLALEFHPDLSLTDSQYNGTPLGWAMHLKRQAIIDLINKNT